LTITQDSFDALLEWLDPARERAAERYEVIHRGLIKIFVSHGLADAEHYADETVDRVIKRLPEIRDTYVSDPIKYFHGVARNIVREATRRKEINFEILPEYLPLRRSGDSELAECLGKCLRALPPDKHALIHDYHIYEGRQKVESHREIAGELSISVGALRTRVHKIRVTLEECVEKCLETSRNKTGANGHI